jgi:hypothetical protein
MKDGGPRTVEAWNARGLGPAGGTVWSTVEDLLRFGRLHLSDGVLPNGVRYAPEGIADLCEPSIDLRIPDWLDALGLGLARWDWPGATAYGWDGVGEGFRATFRFMPRLNAAFVLLTNSTTGREAYRGLIREVVPRLGGGSIPPDRPEPSPPPSEGLVRFSGVYGVPDQHVVVRARPDRLVVDGLEGISALLPIADDIFLADPRGPDVRTVAFAASGPDGHPRAIYDLVWALPRIGE